MSGIAGYRIGLYKGGGGISNNSLVVEFQGTFDEADQQTFLDNLSISFSVA